MMSMPAWFRDIWQDLRFASRLVVRDPWFTFVAVTVLAVGIGVNNTVFTLVNAVLFRSLPVEDPGRLVSIGTRDARGIALGVSYLDYQDWREAVRTMSGIAAHRDVTMNVSDDDHGAERFAGSYLSTDAFHLIGERPILGRSFVAEDEQPGASPVVILGYQLWKTRYASDSTIIGQTIRINGVPSTIVGVMREGFQFPMIAELWQPLTVMPGLAEQGRAIRELGVFGRVSEGATIERARAELEAITSRLARDYPDTNANIQPTVDELRPGIGWQLELIWLALLGAVGFVLLIACANVANLLLARSAKRSREISIRASLGATRWRIVRQLLVESLLLAGLAGALGFGLSVFGLQVVRNFLEGVGGKPYWIQLAMDTRVFTYLAALCLGTGVVFGTAPALQMSRVDLNDMLKESGRSGGALRTRWTGMLLVTELALTLVLLVGAGAMMRNFMALYRSDLVIATSNLLTVRLALPTLKYSDAQQREMFYARLEERLGGIPGVSSSTVASVLPFVSAFPRRLSIDDQSTPSGDLAPTVSVLTIGPDYFNTLSLALLRGRPFTDRDGMPGYEHAIVNQRFAALYFPDQDPTGRRILLTNERGGEPPLWVTIIGVSQTVRQRYLQDAEPVVYLPYRADPPSEAAILVRTLSDDPGATASAIREQVRAIDADLPVFDIKTMDQWIAEVYWPLRLFGTMFVVFAAIALTLSALGLYAITAYTVTARTQEIGVRMALGAEAGQVWWLVLRRALSHTLVGLVLGLVGAFVVGRVLQGVLVGPAGTRDPVTLASITLLLIIVSIVACWVPARRATRLDPVVALRHE